MQEIPAAYWRHARRIVAAETTDADPPAHSWAPTRRLHGELARHLDRFHAQALLQIAVGLASEQHPSLSGADVASDGGLTTRAALEAPAREALLACALGLAATLLGPEAVRRVVGAIWPGLPPDG